ncbi:hypothetical protein ACWA1C_11845 [Flectobacillus roseus]
MLTQFVNFCTKSAARVSLVVSLISILYAFPQFEKLSKDPSDLFLTILQKQIQNPFKPLAETQIVAYGPNRAFRLTAPIIGQLFRNQSINTQAIGIWLFGVLAGFCFFYIMYRYLLEKFESKEKAFYFTLGTSLLFVGNSFFFDMEWFISFAYFFILAAMLSRQKWLSILCLLFAFLTDERAFIASFCVPFFWVHGDNRKLIPSLVTYIFSVVVYLSIYLTLKYYCHLGYASTNDFFTRLLDQFNVIPMTLMLSIKSYWYFFLFFFVPSNKDFPLLHRLAVMGAITVLVFFSLSIADTTKSLSFLFFYAFSFYCMAEKQISAKEVRAVAFAAMFIPSYIFIGWTYGFVSPIGYKQATNLLTRAITHFKK